MSSIATLRRLLALLAAASLSTGCIFVQIEGDLPEDEWLSDIVHGGLTPAGFEHGRSEICFVGTLGGTQGELEMAFRCDEDDLEAYLDGVCDELETRFVQSRDATILERRREDHTRGFDYDGSDGRGEVEVSVESTPDGSYPFRLRIVWEE